MSVRLPILIAKHVNQRSAMLLAMNSTRMSISVTEVKRLLENSHKKEVSFQ